MDVKLALGVLAVLGMCAVAVPTDVSACENGVRWRVDESAQDIMKAERQTNSGEHARAAMLVLKHYPRIKKTRLQGKGMRDRALKTMAQAVVRSDGKLDVGALFPGATAAEQKANLQWSLQVLNGLAMHNPKDARATTDLAEAYAAFPKRHADAKRMLTELEGKDLVATAYGYAALAELRETAGEGKPAFVALPLRTLEHARARVARARCETMAGVAKKICTGGGAS